MRKALADQARELSLMFEGIETADDTAGAVAEKEDRYFGFPGSHYRYKRRDVRNVVLESFDVEPLAFRLAASLQIECMDGKAVRDELLRSPLVIAAVRVESVHNHDRATGLRSHRPPRAGENLEPANSLERSCVH